METPPDSSKKRNFEAVLFLLILLFSWILMWKTFRVREGNMEIASKAWSDFAATIPLIRSFTYGANFPPQYPIFAGPPIRYHFLFFAVVGLLEKVGIRLDWALNSLSAASFFLLIVTIYYFGKTVFGSKAVGILSITLFLFNGSWGFLEFFKRNPLSFSTYKDILSNTQFSSFGPYDGKIVSAFWSLNIFTNQRHLAFAYATFIFLVTLIFILSKHPQKFTWVKAFFFGIVIGLFPFIHMAVFGMLGIALLIFFIIYPQLRIKILVSGSVALILAIPQLLYMGKSQIETQIFHFGYLVEDKSFLGFLKYWFLNLGITLPLAPLGFYLAKKPQRKILIPFLALFVAGNLFQFSPEIAANHKFFNISVIGINSLTALFLIKLWNKHFAGKIVSIFLLLFLTLTGIIDFFPIINDSFVTLPDLPKNQAAAFIEENTPKGAVFLNSSYLYHPASVAGRKIFMGWPYFAWSAGYDTSTRGKELESVFTSKNKDFICDFLEKRGIDYLTTQDTHGDRDFPTIDLAFFRTNFVSIFKEGDGFTIYDTSLSCE